MDPNNYVLYSNRSFAFLKLDQHYLSLQDANETIRLQPQWAKGYFRRAEVEAAGGLYDEAIISYTRALQLDPQNTNQNIIWVCSCVGLIFGILVVILDYSLTKTPTLSNPFSMVAFSIALSGIGWMAGKAATMMGNDAGKSLQPPDDLANEEKEKEKRLLQKKRNIVKHRHDTDTSRANFSLKFVFNSPYMFSKYHFRKVCTIILGTTQGFSMRS
ncbi:hypothetical protein MSG28_015934 [Choristoneura fumiferana]|uniref:Uncharacterized protein n=1 Tax=Choristoneura fumiferana TaxID=7141 RepID=A0ACC0K4S1_CHOFU|nr:hypothetical protein MSG28_015934 [Choristoneura fumiferana]